MKITVQASGGTPIVLADGAFRAVGKSIGPAEFSLGGRRLVQEQQFLRAAAVSVLDRANLKTVIKFRVSREHASVQDAEYFLLSHYVDLPGSGTVTFAAKNSAGAEKRLKLAAAAIAVTDHSYSGCRTFHAYEISGGAMEAAT